MAGELGDRDIYRDMAQDEKWQLLTDKLARMYELQVEELIIHKSGLQE